MKLPTLPLTGSCRCGDVHVEITIAPLMTAACHCKGCQKMSASAYSLTAMIPVQGFAVTKGVTQRGGIGHGQLNHQFCPRCKTWMFTGIEGIDELAARLSANVPVSSEGTIVHGDYRLDNVLVDTQDGDRITTVLDWEMSTLGDPLTDVAIMLAYQNLALAAGPAGSAQVTDAPLAPGYLSPDDVVERYAMQSGRDVSELGFHLGLAYFKLAVILEGIHYRYTQGQTLGAGFEGIGTMIDPLVRAGLDATSK